MAIAAEIPDVNTPACPICGCREFITYRGRKREKCKNCRCHIRTRSTFMLVNEFARNHAQSKIAHFAPEPPLGRRLFELYGDNYYAFDYDNERYSFPFEVKYVDLCQKLINIPHSYFDIVIHNHVIEHLKCNYTIVLQRIHELIKPGGWHIFSMPIYDGSYSEHFSDEMTGEVRRRRFGQEDHIRRFSRHNFDETIGMIFDLNKEYSLADFIAPEKLLAAAIPAERWTLELGPVFAVQRQPELGESG